MTTHKEAMNMIERVARAIAATEGWELPEDMTLPYAPSSRIGKVMSSARAAVEAMREATPEMYRQGIIANAGPRSTAHGYIYDAMISAVLKEE